MSTYNLQHISGLLVSCRVRQDPRHLTHICCHFRCVVFVSFTSRSGCCIDISKSSCGHWERPRSFINCDYRIDPGCSENPFSSSCLCQCSLFSSGVQFPPPLPPPFQQYLMHSKYKTPQCVSKLSITQLMEGSQIYTSRLCTESTVSRIPYYLPS